MTVRAGELARKHLKPLFKLLTMLLCVIMRLTTLGGKKNAKHAAPLFTNADACLVKMNSRDKMVSFQRFLYKGIMLVRHIIQSFYQMLTGLWNMYNVSSVRYFN